MFLSSADMPIDYWIKDLCPNTPTVEESLAFDERAITEWCTLLGCSREAKIITPELLKHLTEDDSISDSSRAYFKEFFTQEEHLHPSMKIYANQELNRKDQT